jgi:branched-chain amino acid transport system substrate-binding protein
MLNRRQVLKMSVILMCIFLAISASPSFSDDGKLMVGVVLPLSGQRSNFGIEALKGMNLAAEIINDGGGIDDRQLDLLVRDNEGDPAKTALQAKELIRSENALAIVGPITSTNSAAAAAVAQEHQTPLVLPVATSPFVTEIGDFIVRICATDPRQSKALAEFSRKDLKAERVAILYEKDSDYSEKLADFYTLRFEDSGGKIVFAGSTLVDSSDLISNLNEALSTHPDLIFLPLYYPEAAEIVTYLKNEQKSVTILGGDGWDSPELFHRAGKDIIPGEIFISSHYSSDMHTSIGDEFIERFQNKYQGTPNAISALGYDAIMVLADAIDRSTVVNRKGIRDALVTTEDFQGVTGQITINEKRNALKDIFILTALKDHFAFYARISNF